MPKSDELELDIDNHPDWDSLSKQQQHDFNEALLMGSPNVNALLIKM
jgi:hypothetical protein